MLVDHNCEPNGILSKIPRQGTIPGVLRENSPLIWLDT